MFRTQIINCFCSSDKFVSIICSFYNKANWQIKSCDYRIVSTTFRRGILSPLMLIPLKNMRISHCFINLLFQQPFDIILIGLQCQSKLHNMREKNILHTARIPNLEGVE